MKLLNSSEIIGTLESFAELNNQIKLKFTIYEEIEIPESGISMEMLDKLQGKKVGIINVDGQFLVRKA